MQGGQALAGAARLGQLRVLNMAGTLIGVEGAFSILTSKQFPHLKELDLRDVSIDDEGARRLAATEGLQRLEVLNLEHNPITEAGLDSLRAAAKDVRIIMKRKKDGEIFR